MTPKEYEYKKRNCFRKFLEDNLVYTQDELFDYTFDYAYNLGKEEIK